MMVTSSCLFVRQQESAGKPFAALEAPERRLASTHQTSIPEIEVEG